MDQIQNRPESPLPWSLNSRCLSDAKDLDYLVHACNAYPKLVDFLLTFTEGDPHIESAWVRDILTEVREWPKKS